MRYALIILALTLVPAAAYAHPGRTDANGGHYCRTNCEKWGLKYDEYQYHNSISETVKPAKVKARVGAR